MEETSLLPQYNTETFLMFTCSMNYFHGRHCSAYTQTKAQKSSQDEFALKDILTLIQNNQYDVEQRLF